MTCGLPPLGRPRKVDRNSSEQNRVGHGGLTGIEGGLAGVGLAAVELEALEAMPGDFSDDVGSIDHEAGLDGKPTGFLAVDVPQV